LRGNPFAYSGDKINRQGSTTKRITYGVDSQFTESAQPKSYDEIDHVSKVLKG
jgi:hypothetical protein